MNDPTLTSTWRRTREIAIEAEANGEHHVNLTRMALEKLVEAGQAEVRHEIEHPNGSKQYLQWRAVK